MKVLFGVPFLYPAIAYGGAARAAFDLARALQRAGHEIAVLTTDVLDQNNRFNGNFDPAPFKVERLQNLSNSMAYWCQFYTPLRFHASVEKLLRNVQIVHLHTYRNLLNDRLARAAYKAGIPFLLTGHGTVSIIERFHKIKFLYDQFIGKWQIVHAAAIIAVSHAEKEKLTAFGIPQSKIYVIPNGIPDISPTPLGKFRKKWNLSLQEKVILFLGKITERKGLQFVVRAVSQSPSAKLVIAGNDMGYEKQIDHLIRKLGISDRIIRTGLLNDEEKTAALTDADLTVYPSRDETFGMVAAESILCGTPVIVGDDDGCAQLIKKLGAGDVVGWGNVDQLTQLIQLRLIKGKEFQELERAKEILFREFNWENVAAETSKLYENVGALL